MNIVDLNNKKYTGETIHDVEDFLYTAERFWKTFQDYVLERPLFLIYKPLPKWFLFDDVSPVVERNDQGIFCLRETCGTLHCMKNGFMVAVLPGDVEKCHELAG